MVTILVTIVVTLSSLGAAVVASDLIERRRRRWRAIANDRRRRGQARIEAHREQISLGEPR